MSSTVSLRITLRYKDLDEFGARYAENISSAGLFLRTRTPKPTGTRIRFELLLADGARAFFGEGVVVSVRHDDKAGMGIRYHSLDPDSQQVMEKIVAQHGEGPLAPTPLGIPAKQAGSSVWRPGAAPQWGAAQTARPSAPPSSGGLLPRDGWGRPRTPPKSEAPPPAKEVRRRSATLRPWERTGSETAQAPKPAEPDDLSRTLLLPEWDDLARTTIVGAESPAGLARPADQHTVRLSVPDALSAAIAPAGGFTPPTTGAGLSSAPASAFTPPTTGPGLLSEAIAPSSGFAAGPDTSPELPAIHAWRPSAAPPGRSVWTVPGAPSTTTPASEGPTTQIDLRADDAEAQSTARIDLSLVQAAGVRAAEASDEERADPAWLEELSSSEIQPLTVPVGEEGEWNVEAAHAYLRDEAEAARIAAEEAEAARIAQVAAREAFALQAAEAERAQEARQAEALRNADTMSFEAPETRQAREQHLRADAARDEAAAARAAEAAREAEARDAPEQRAAEVAREAEARDAPEQRAAEVAREAEAREAEAREAEAREAEAREAEAREAEAREAEAREAEAREAEAREAEAREAEAREGAEQGATVATREAEAQETAAQETAAQEAAAQEAAAQEAAAQEAAAQEAAAQEAAAQEAAAEAARETEAQRAAEAAREAEAQRAAEAAREAEAQRAAEAAREAEAQRAAEAAREAEAQRAAEAAREAEAQRAAEAAREAEAQRAAEAAREAEVQRAAEAAAQMAEAQRAAEKAQEAEARRAAEAAAQEFELQRAAEAQRAQEAARLAEAQAHRVAQEAEAARFAAAQEALAREAAEEARQVEEAEALRIAQAGAREAAAMAASSRAAETPSSGGPTERVGVNVLAIDELPRPLAEGAADATIADVTFKSWASEVGPASNIPAPSGGTTERIDLPPPILLADPEPIDATPILAVGVATEAALEPALPSQTPEPDYALVHPVPEGPNLRASLPPEEGGTPGLRAPIHLAVREIDDREAVLPFEPPSLGLDPEPTPAPRAAELRVSSKLGSAPLVDEAFARDDQAIQDQSSALSRPRSARTIVERVPSSELVVEPTGRLEPKAQLDQAGPGAGGQRIEVASELYRAEAPAPRAKPGDEVITAVEIDRREQPKPVATQLREEEGTQRIDVHQARLDVNEVIAQSAARVPLEARTELLSSAHPPVPTAHPSPTLSTAVSVGPVAPSVESAREPTKEAPRREVSSAGPVAPSRAPAVDAQDLRRAVGIDIGGRYARLALLELGKVDLLKIEGQAALPAVVALLPSGALVTGADALGEPESSRVSVRALLLAVSGLAVAPVENLSGRWVAKIAGENVELLEILRVFFQPLGAAATRALGTPKVRGILLVPPGASNEAIDLVQRAAKATGLDITEAVPEPLAAGRAYDLDRQPVETALVIDVAATHLGATVLRRGRDGLRPVGGKSWPSPSGAELDHALGAVVNEEVKKILGRPAPEDASYLAQLELELERARRELKKEQAVDLKLKVGDKVISVKLARPRAFQATEPVVSEILGKVREVLSEAGVHPRALGAVVVVGSAGGYGGLSQALQSLTGREALTSIDPLTGPFHGLTRPSELIKAPEDRLAPSEGIPFDIGIGLPGGRFRALFPAGTKLPAKQSKKHATTKDAQTDMEFSLYEGRSELLSECRPLGTVALSGLPRAARGQVSVELELELDLDAVLACTLSEAKSGHKRRVELPTANTPAARKKSLESRPSVEDFGTAPKPKTKVGLLGRLLGKS